jgi:hypothetical protein
MPGMVHHVDAPDHKVIRNWEDFLKEVGTIFIGVMIALVADQAVDAWNWHKEVAIVEDSLNDELSDSLFAAEERIKITECQRQTLDALDDLADKSHGTLVIQNTPVSRNRVWGSAAWEAAVASGSIAHMPHNTRNTYAQLFSFVRVFRDMNLRQQELWATINAYRRQRPFTDTSRDRFVETVSQLRSLTHSMNLGAQQFVEAAKPLNIQLDPRDAETLRAPRDCPMP